MLVAAAVVATLLQQSAFHAGSLQTSVPAMLVLEPIVAVMLGQFVLGEHLIVSGPQRHRAGDRRAGDGRGDHRAGPGRRRLRGRAGSRHAPSRPLTRMMVGVSTEPGSPSPDRREPGRAAVGAFFDLDGTLVAGFTAMAHAE